MTCSDRRGRFSNHLREPSPAASRSTRSRATARTHPWPSAEVRAALIKPRLKLEHVEDVLRLPGITSTALNFSKPLITHGPLKGAEPGSAIHGAGPFSTVTRAQYGNGINGCPCR